MHFAVEVKGCVIEEIKALIDAGVDLNIKNMRGYSAFDVAVNNRNTEAEDLLRDYLHQEAENLLTEKNELNKYNKHNTHLERLKAKEVSVDAIGITFS